MHCYSEIYHIILIPAQGGQCFRFFHHELNPEDIDGILAEDFIGCTNSSKWNREDHRKLWSDSKGEDKILHLIAEGDLVAIRFMRTMERNGKMIKLEMMGLMQFENGKIAEIWEYYDSGPFAGENGATDHP